VIFLASAGDQHGIADAREATKADFVTTSLTDALDQIAGAERRTEHTVDEKLGGEVLPFPDPVSGDRREVVPGT
jgi:hypothetical protein